MDIRWFAIYDKATGQLYTQASVDLDDEDTAIDEKTGLPYSLSGLRGIAHPDVMAGTHEYRKDLGVKEDADALVRSPEHQRKIAPRKTPLEGRGPLEAVELAFNPQTPPDGDPDGAREWDAAARQFVDRSGAVLRMRRLTALRGQERALEAAMVERGETLPPRV